ncbi:MAG: DUF11 domain-containing protein [Clostridium sp.]|uniref:DUF11 domain-containing protein n=1 Tax=Clostridium sp. TaxID=1506 RepID=UPI003F3601D1
MALNLRFSQTGPLKMVHTGNTVGMSANSLYCATGITLDPNLNSGNGITSSFSVDTYAGTSTVGTNLGSWAVLNPSPADVPLNSTVVFAVLTLQSYTYQPSGNVTLIDSNSVAHTVNLNWTDSYSGSANVTSIVQNSGRGSYAVKNISFAGGYDVHGIGWGLLIAYTEPTMPIRNLSFYTGFIQNGGSATASGFSTPSFGIVKARVYAQSVEANYFAGGDTLTLNSVALSGPYNPATNFFNNQVCDYTGLVTTIGSFAQYNVPQQTGTTPFTGTTYARDMFDITNVKADGALTNNSTSTTVGIGSSGDVLFLGMLGLEIDANQAYLTPIKYVDKSITSPGNTVIYTLVLVNDGGTVALTGFVQDTLPANTTLVPNSLNVNGVPNSGNIEAGIDLGSVPFGTVYTITYAATINTNAPITDTISNFAYTQTTFRSINGGPIYSAGRVSNTVDTTLFIDNTSIIKSIDKSMAFSGDTITYTIEIYNNDSLNELTNIKFIDSIPNTTTFVPNSFSVNGTIISNTTPQNGIALNITIPSLTLATISFKVITNGTIGTIPNTSFIDYSIISPTTIINNNNLSSNTVNFIYKYVDINATKTVDKTFSTTGDTLTYSFSITNLGNSPAINLILKDTIPNGTSFVPGSVLLNGISSTDVPTSINIGTLNPNELKTISFKVLIN